MVIKRRSRRITKRRKPTLSSKKSNAIIDTAKQFALNMKKPLRAYREIERKIDKTWKKLRSDVKRRSRNAIEKGRNDLLMLLGECNYMAKECARSLRFKHR
jgi:hypothetical protein